MKERSIIFKAEEVRAILAGRKTQTRRIVEPQSAVLTDEMARALGVQPPQTQNPPVIPCPFGESGDRLWVREAFSPVYPQDPHYNNGNPIEYDYKATYTHGERLGDCLGIKKVWKPSIHMPREASRITLEVTGVRVERLQDISEADAKAEGATGQCPVGNLRIYNEAPLSYHFAQMWDAINKSDQWVENPWVWVINFKRISK